MYLGRGSNPRPSDTWLDMHLAAPESLTSKTHQQFNNKKSNHNKYEYLIGKSTKNANLIIMIIIW